ncbi:MAG: DNA polymerase III subunit chi [Wenzhouxiangella sp.]
MRVDFYEMGGRFTDPLFVAGVLVGRAWPQARTVALVARRSELETLDELLWKTPEGRFLPHGIEQPEAPIRLLEEAPDSAEVLINLDPKAPLPAGRFGRVLEIIPPDEALKQPLRERWKAWKARGADVHHHILK